MAVPLQGRNAMMAAVVVWLLAVAVGAVPPPPPPALTSPSTPSSSLPPPTPLPDFRSDCADPHNSQVKCTVQKWECGEDSSIPLVAPGQEPPEAHDLRVDSVTKMIGKEAKHQLHVDISWQMPPSNDSFRLRAFLLEIESKYGKDEHHCFVFNVSDYSWSGNSSSPRFRFKTDSLFSFSSEYIIRVGSLPSSSSHRPEASKTVAMAQNPGDHRSGPNTTQECRMQANPQASKWTAGFRKIFLHALARTIQIQFVAAPPSLCFQAYEVRLLDEGGLELLHNHIIEASELVQVVENGQTVYLGEHNFTNLETDIDFIPSVMPVERAMDGRCLCPVASDPSDRQVVCSCIAADWKKVRLVRAPPPPSPSSTLPPPKPLDAESSTHIMPLTVIAIVTILLFAVILIVICCIALRKYRSRGKLMHTRLVPETQAQLLMDSRQGPVACGTAWTVLIVYSHDCALHEAAVEALAEFLRDSFNMKVHLDVWERDDMEDNFHEYINSSILRADKVLIINSVGAFCRLQGRARKQPLERLVPGQLDHLFEAQIDLALQHARVISMRFAYSPSTATLFSLSPLLQYSVPENLPLLLAALTESSARNDPRLLVGGSGGYDPALERLRACITRMHNYMEEHPDWVERSHRRVPLAAIPRLPAPLPLLPLLSPQEGETVDPLHSFVPASLEEVDDVEASTSVHPLLPPKEEAEETGGDSAYLSNGFVSRDEEHEEGGWNPLVEMAMIPLQKGEEEGEGGEEGEEEESSLDEERDEVDERRAPRIEDALRVKAKHQQLSNGDSGNISDFHSGLVENY